jgi:hypothetical protein|tara:strand:- start:257 stop:748 length:492 start_codon:yes stop_codon:yes gene_type:complete
MEINKETLAKAIQGIEVKKQAYRQTREGTIVSFLIQPDDVAELLTQELSVSEIGARYMLGIVRLDEETDYPVIPEQVTIGERAMRRASMLCRDADFQSWVRLNVELFDPTGEIHMDDDEEYVSVIMRDYCGILSRKELQTNKDAQEKLRDLIDKYQKDKRRTT